MCLCSLIVLGMIMNVAVADGVEPKEPTERAVTLEGGDYGFADAPEINVGVFYHIEKDDHVNQYRKINLPETGTYHFYMRNMSDDSFGIKIRDVYNKDITRVSNHGRAPYIVELDLEAGTYYFKESSGGFYSWFPAEAYFAVCSPSRHAGDLSDYEVIQKPTCTEPGYQAQHCLLCGGEANIVEIPATGHIAGDAIVARSATCTQDGESYIRCAACGVEMETQVIPATGHVPGTEEVFQEATCLTPGIKGVKCVTCGAILSQEEIPTTGHKAGVWVDIKPVTCLADGQRAQRCSVCGETLNTEIMPAFGHSPMEWQITKEPDCLTNGRQEKKCAICGAVLETEAVPALGHSYSEWEVVKQPSLFSEGVHKRHCFNCGEEFTENYR